MEIHPIALADKMMAAAGELEKSDAALYKATLEMNRLEALYDKAYAIVTLRMQAGEEMSIEETTPVKVSVTNQPRIAHAMCGDQYLAFQASKANVQRIKAKTERIDKVISVCQSINKNLSHVVD
jgi:hypothetical protein